MDQKLHLTEIEALLAESYIGNSQSPLSVNITKADDQGNINLHIGTNVNAEIESPEIDFEFVITSYSIHYTKLYDTHRDLTQNLFLVIRSQHLHLYRYGD